MDARKLAKILKEIEESTLLVDYLLFQGLEFDLLCACDDPKCQTCLYNDQHFFSEKVVRAAKEWRNGNDG